MKATTIICDRCGKSVPDSDFCEFFIRRSINHNGIFKGVDLCPECEKILGDWLDRDNIGVTTRRRG